MNEFDIIAKYFQLLSEEKVSFDNDAAVLEIPEGHELVVTSDTLNAGTHFFADALPGDIACKALRVNVSDLAAMGAKPFCYQLNLALPSKPSEEWFKEFTSALINDQKAFGIFCSGGDTTSIDGPLSISITAMGLVEKGKAWKRSGAKVGDDIVLSGPVGDAWIGLEVLRGRLKTDHDEFFVEKYYKPEVEFLSDPVHAAIDVSDGLIADLTHICKSSGIGAHIKVEDIQFSDQARVLIESQAVSVEQLLTGGDDYRLLMAVPQGHTIAGAQIIGRFTKESGVNVYDKNGGKLQFQHTGWSHF